ncbi:hypothetical protein BEN49_03745 [Hymenobacter coccineus]|uniref:Uncharacterized protein n=1 Tax=Hymenobacter coccineus TaxID=1908235 RepID=A0A1G1TMV8_9BACT|nr:hypothetical protein BEN49_03745 [Hymenobacter coccineus]
MPFRFDARGGSTLGAPPRALAGYAAACRAASCPGAGIAVGFKVLIHKIKTGRSTPVFFALKHLAGALCHLVARPGQAI